MFLPALGSSDRANWQNNSFTATNNTTASKRGISMYSFRKICSKIKSSLKSSANYWAQNDIIKIKKKLDFGPFTLWKEIYNLNYNAFNEGFSEIVVTDAFFSKNEVIW